ncbi:MAG: NUDIX domain-containing protein [Candidatus Magasanikbacteria bacterium]|nr:NUDIX domain-containing protein [Candidatus Magasanikbacteria bacterium]
MENRPKVGVGVIVIKDNKVLCAKRKGAHGEGTWQFPGGHLEFKESWEDCARREVMEETGMSITNIRFGTVSNDVFETENKHYITLIMIANHELGEPQILEPEKCAGWEWFKWEELPEPLFLPIVNIVKNGFNPFKLNE